MVMLCAFLTQCSAPQKTRSDVLRVVEYQGYVSEGSLKELVRYNTEAGEDIVLIFAADWCKACQGLRQLMDTGGISASSSSIVFVNVDESWAAHLAQVLGVLQIPAMIHFNSEGDVRKISFGQYKILVYLLAHFR